MFFGTVCRIFLIWLVLINNFFLILHVIIVVVLNNVQFDELAT